MPLENGQFPLGKFIDLRWFQFVVLFGPSGDAAVIPSWELCQLRDLRLFPLFSHSSGVWASVIACCSAHAWLLGIPPDGGFRDHPFFPIGDVPSCWGLDSIMLSVPRNRHCLLVIFLFEGASLVVPLLSYL